MAPRVEYALTALGTTLLDIVLSLIDWVGTHHQDIHQNQTAFDAAHADRPADPQLTPYFRRFSDGSMARFAS